MTDKRFHSVRLEGEKCRGCTNCLKRCPTEAIRVRGGRAHIIDERCIDCGECIRVCGYHAKVAVTDPLSSISGFKYKIALPAPSLYGQFQNLKSISQVLNGKAEESRPAQAGDLFRMPCHCTPDSGPLSGPAGPYCGCASADGSGSHDRKA